MDWEITFEWKNTKTSDSHIQASLGARAAVVTFAKDVSRKDSVGFLALHEAIELLLIPLRVQALERFTTEFQIDEASHAIVQRLIKVFYEGEGKGSKS
jgi:hypothetical protein